MDDRFAQTLVIVMIRVTFKFTKNIEDCSLKTMQAKLLYHRLRLPDGSIVQRVILFRTETI